VHLVPRGCPIARMRDSGREKSVQFHGKTFSGSTVRMSKSSK
jgi:hypothetical protein